ncbi:hypothetical protein ACMZ5E_15420 [Streptomyces rhizosphaericola]|uniref:hypothetical protein n=1 Tax=Streptomyces rhizosphaericola TaxID=2564098 RepID=UPI0039EE118C
MSRSNQRSVRRRALLTAELYRQARAHLPAEGPIIAPARHEDQEVLEAELLSRLLDLSKSWPGGHPSLPLGIARCTPLPGSIDVRVESRQQAIHLLQRLLPHQEIGGDGSPDIAGIAGLRVGGIRGDALVLSALDREACVTLSGLPGREWQRLTDLVDRAHRDKAGGRTPLWRLPVGSHPAEPGSAMDSRRGRRSAWLGSWLLRRPGLFQNLTAPHLLEGYGRPGVWTLELCHLPSSPLRAEPLVRLLRHPEVGIPYKLRVRHCSRVMNDGSQQRSTGRGEGWARGDDRSGQVIIDIGDPGETVLDLRFHRDPATFLRPAVRNAAVERIDRADLRYGRLADPLAAEVP